MQSSRESIYLFFGTLASATGMLQIHSCLLKSVDVFLSFNVFIRSPIALGYTRGHFCALVPPEPDLGCGGAGGGAAPPTPPPTLCAYLPLVNHEREILPLHFTSR